MAGQSIVGVDFAVLVVAPTRSIGAAGSVGRIPQMGGEGKRGMAIGACLVVGHGRWVGAKRGCVILRGTLRLWLAMSQVRARTVPRIRPIPNHSAMEL